MPDLNPVSTSSQTPVTNTAPAIQQAALPMVVVSTYQEQREPSATIQAPKAISARKTDVATTTKATLEIDIPIMASDLFKTILKRLSLMREVAECKLILGKDIFDQDREKKVLESASRIAKEYGINENSYKSFIQALMTAAKVIQNKYFELFDKEKLATVTTDDKNKAENKLKELRVQLIEHSKIMGQQISEYLGKYKA